MILRGSRYEGVPFTGLQTDVCTFRKFLHDRRVFSKNDIGTNAGQHIVKGEEELDSIAEHYYGDGSLWWLIADVNDIEFAFDIKPGDTLVIPDPAIRTRKSQN